jgi:hypothetical protein
MRAQRAPLWRLMKFSVAAAQRSGSVTAMW